MLANVASTFHSLDRVWIEVSAAPARLVAGPTAPHRILSLAATVALCNGLLPELRSCVKVEVAVLGSPSLISLMVSVDVKQH